MNAKAIVFLFIFLLIYFFSLKKLDGQLIAYMRILFVSSFISTDCIKYFICCICKFDSRLYAFLNFHLKNAGAKNGVYQKNHNTLK